MTSVRGDECPPLRVKRLSEYATLPVRATDGSAGYDIASAEEVCLEPSTQHCFRTDIKVAVPPGHYGRLAPRSGLAMKNSIDVLAGVCDSDYRGGLCVLLINHDDKTLNVKVGTRIAQLILEKISTPPVEDVGEGELDETTRGEKGFGSTGMEAIAYDKETVWDAELRAEEEREANQDAMAREIEGARG